MASRRLSKISVADLMHLTDCKNKCHGRFLKWEIITGWIPFDWRASPATQLPLVRTGRSKLGWTCKVISYRTSHKVIRTLRSLTGVGVGEGRGGGGPSLMPLLPFHEFHYNVAIPRIYFRSLPDHNFCLRVLMNLCTYDLKCLRGKCDTPFRTKN